MERRATISKRRRPLYHGKAVDSRGNQATVTERNYRDVSPDSDDLDNPSENEALPPFPMLVVLEGSLALVALLLGWALDHHPLSDFEWSPRAAIQGLEATLPLIGLLWLSHRWKIEPILRIHDFLRRELLPYLDGANLLDFAMLSLAAGVGEEILFRGIVQPVISLQVGVIAGLVLTSLIFGCLHPAATSARSGSSPATSWLRS